MTLRPLLSLRLRSSLAGFATLAGLAGCLGLAPGCNSSAAGPTVCNEGETMTCACPDGHTGTQLCGEMECSCDEGDAGAAVADADAALEDSSSSMDTPGDATHKDDHESPMTVYSVCAVQGSFGWPCTLTTSGPDTAECTDPNYPECFVGGQSSWCTASCAEFGTCPGPESDAGDAGCVPSACNARGYCK